MKRIALPLAVVLLVAACANPAVEDDLLDAGSASPGDAGADSAASSQDAGAKGDGQSDTKTDGGIAVVDGSVTLPDAAMPTTCTLGASGATALIPTETMAPGTACGGCHALIGKPISISGTVYSTSHEPDLCLGVTGVGVEIVDANGAAHQLGVNASGNFLQQNLLQVWPSPWKVAVTRGSARLPMVGTVTNGDCNSCHTAAGSSGAPGRILAP